MRAVGLMVHGGPEVLEVVDLEAITAGPGQIRIRNFAAAVNPTDIVARDGTRAKLQSQFPPPYVPGMDAAGVVDQVGQGVTTGVKVGDRVMAMVVPKASHGAYREQLVLNQRAVVPAPAGTTHLQASTLPMNALTARLSLDLLELSPGQVLGVTGGPGAYGGYVIELAKAAGLTVIADAAQSDRARLQTLGADVVIARGEGFAERIREHFPDGVDGVADGALLNDKAIPAVKDGGAFTAIRGFRGEPQREIRFTETWVTQYNERYDLLDALRQQAEQGQLTLRVADTVPPERAGDAHRRLAAGGTRGRMVIDFT
ncbi:MAG: zinc-binding dehydrogenase [Proteobacteria bacterium]|nr:zinc-binding dehydrogenase [Pseudomonadota bacterium]